MDLELKYIWKIYAAMWLSTAIAVSVAVYVTNSAWCLWAFMFPALHAWKRLEGEKETESSDA